MKIQKDDKAEVNYGYECGIKLKDNFLLKEGDRLEINVMIPLVPDKKFVYMATLSYVKELLNMGNNVNVYLYNGFIHSKVVMIDDKVVSIGTCNFDNRSFELNFEINAFLYGEEASKQNIEIFENDISNSKKIDKGYFRRKIWYSKLAQAFFRLFSPLL